MRSHLKIIILVLLSAMNVITNAQNKLDYCAFLQKVIESKEFGWNFGFSKDTNIILVDTAKVFKDCTSLSLHGRHIEIIDSYPSYFVIQRNRANQDKLNKNDYTKIVVGVQVLKHGEVKLYFWRPLSNSDALFKVKRRFGGIHVKLLSAGVF